MKQQKNNLDEIDKMLYEYFENNKEIPEETAKVIENTFHKKKKSHLMIFRAVATVCTVFLLTTGVVFAKDIANLISQMFNLSDIDIENNGIVNAIENKEYIQNVDMEYIKLDNEYGMKIDYLLIDDINLYMVFNLYSEKEVKENIRFSILDLSISDEEGNIIYSGNVEQGENKVISMGGWNNISTETNVIKELFFLMTNGIPDTEKLNIVFTKVKLYNSERPNKDNVEINSEFEYKIDLIDKFKNREKIEYIVPEIKGNEYEIKKCIATDTGLYLLYKTQNSDMKFELSNIKSNQNCIGRHKYNEYYFITQFDISKEELENKPHIEIIDSNDNKIKLEKL